MGIVWLQCWSQQKSMEKKINDLVKEGKLKKEKARSNC